MKLLKEHKKINLPNNIGYMSINETEDNKIIIKRLAFRGNITNYISTYEKIYNTGESKILPLTLDISNEILKRIENNYPYSSVYIFYDNNLDFFVSLDKTAMEHTYTSTGIKFWRHQQQMENYKNSNGNTVISTHISPEGLCNLKCPYCSVTYRDTHSRIPLETIQDYVEKLQSRGLKAVIISGGGEPTLYKNFNELIKWLKYDRKLSVALITNGTSNAKIEEKTWKAFSWIRISINIFDNWEKRINIPIELLNSECIVGCSMVHTNEHEYKSEKINRLEILNKVKDIADKLNAKYVRLLPNCLLEQKDLLIQHKVLDKILEEFNDKRFFHQHKVHKAPQCSLCHQAYFRPYLSEEIYHKNGKPGTVYPCDSIVLNNSYQHFHKQYQICHASEILDFLDRKIEMKFNPKIQCTGCVFTDNINLLDDWKNKGINSFNEFKTPIQHEEFV